MMRLRIDGRWRGVLFATALVVLGVVAFVVQRSMRAEQIPAGWAADQMKPIGYSSLDGRGGAFKLAIKEVNGKWYLYMGHLWHRGWTIVDVTDPAAPKFVKFIPGPENTWTIQMDLHDNVMLTALQGCSKAWGCDPDKPHDEGIIFWDISDPVNPKQLSHWKTGGNGTHRNSYPGGRYAYATANMPGFRGQILVILDVSDPRNPKEAGRWWMPGQKEGEPQPERSSGLHGPAIIDGTTAYLGYGFSVVILDIADVSQPKLVGKLEFPAFKGVHDVALIPGRSLLYAHSEAIAGDGPDSTSCEEMVNFSGMIDIKDPTKPRLISLFPTPLPPEGAPYTNFCDKGARFGPHNTNLEYHLPDVEKQGNLIYATYFNAGLRIFDIKDPRLPKEVGWFIPPTPTERMGPIPAGNLVTQTEDVLVDRRGNVYLTDKQWGLWVVRSTADTDQ